MSEEQRREVEQARQQSRLSAEKFEKVFLATEPKRQLPKAPTGRPPESIPHSRVQPEHLQRVKPEPLPKPPRTIFRTRTVQAPRQKQRRSRRRSRRGTFGFSFRSKKAGGRPPNLPDSPANIDPEEKKRLLERLDLALAKENRKYATEIRHGSPDPKQQQTRQKIQQLENQKRAVQNMKPTGRFRYSLLGGLQRLGSLPGHVREAEKG